MPTALIVLLVAIAFVGGWLLWRFLPSRADPAVNRSPRFFQRRSKFPSEGLLVSEDLLRATRSSSSDVMQALEAAAAPVALEYFPVSDSEVAKYRAVPVNASVQHAMSGILGVVKPKGPTLYRAVLPKGAELVRAVGGDGYRGFSRTAGVTSHALLTPVAVTGAAAAIWPVFAVAAAVTAADTFAQREQRAHQRRVEASLGRIEQRYYVERIKDQQSADAQLTRAISLILDGRAPNIELALKSADDELYRAKQFLEGHRGVIDGVIDGLVDGAGKVDVRELERALGGETKEIDHFVRELYLARAAIAIGRKSLITHAAAAALADPGNPYTALRRVIDNQMHLLEQTEVAAVELTEKLTQLEFKGGWFDSDSWVALRQIEFREKIAPRSVDRSPELLYLSTASGQVFQLLSPEEDANHGPVTNP